MTATSDGVPDRGTPPPSLSVYWLATRSYSFPASIVPVLLGTVLAARGYGGAEHGQWNLPAFFLTLIGAVLAHSGGNVLNDYYDYVKGVDTLAEHGSGVLPQKLLTPAEMFRFGWACLAGAALCGLLLLTFIPWALSTILPLAVIGLCCAVFYTAVLKEHALGDLVIMTAFGLGLTLGAYAVQQPLQNWGQIGQIVLLSVPVSLLVDGILHANNMRDVESDSTKGVKTLATVLGKSGSMALHSVLVFGPVATACLFSVLHLIPLTGFLTVLSLPLLIKAYKTGDVPFTAQSHLVFGILYALGVGVLAQP